MQRLFSFFSNKYSNFNNLFFRSFFFRYRNVLLSDRLHYKSVLNFFDNYTKLSKFRSRSKENRKFKFRPISNSYVSSFSRIHFLTTFIRSFLHSGNRISSFLSNNSFNKINNKISHKITSINSHFYNRHNNYLYSFFHQYARLNTRTSTFNRKKYFFLSKNMNRICNLFFSSKLNKKLSFYSYFLSKIRFFLSYLKDSKFVSKNALFFNDFSISNLNSY